LESYEKSKKKKREVTKTKVRIESKNNGIDTLPDWVGWEAQSNH